MGFFDIFAQVGRCGCGILIKFYVHHYVTGWFGRGLGSNIRAKLLASWGLLLLATYKHITNVHICGDSRTMINWLRGLASLQVAGLMYWQHRIEDLRTLFSSLSFQHIYKEYNALADTFSKKVIGEFFGTFHFEEF